MHYSQAAWKTGWEREGGGWRLHREDQLPPPAALSAGSIASSALEGGPKSRVCLQEHPLTKACRSSVFTNVRRKSNILVYNFSPAKPVRWHSDPCQPPSCPHHLLQSATWLLYAHLSPAIRSGHRLIHVPGISLFFLQNFLWFLQNHVQSILPSLWSFPSCSDCEINIHPLARNLAC